MSDNENIISNKNSNFAHVGGEHTIQNCFSLVFVLELRFLKKLKKINPLYNNKLRSHLITGGGGITIKGNKKQSSCHPQADIHQIERTTT